jgi:hypothetical protein
MNYSELVPHIQQNLIKHHELYTQQCKGTLWEELCSKSLNEIGKKTDWKPNFDHKSGKDQTIINEETEIGNKTGTYDTINNILLSVSGSRLQKYKTLEEKLKFLDQKNQDYIFLLSVDKKTWKKNNKYVYYFIVIDSNNLQYSNCDWDAVIGEDGQIKNWVCSTEYYNAKIQRSMSDQLWTYNIDSSLFEFIEKIEIDN